MRAAIKFGGSVATVPGVGGSGSLVDSGGRAGGFVGVLAMPPMV